MLETSKCVKLKTSAAINATVIDVTSWQYEVNTDAQKQVNTSVTLLQSEADFILQPASVCVLVSVAC